MALDPSYITSVDLNPYLVDKDTGAPLAGGYIYFYEDNARTTPKSVYQITGSPPNYTYTALPNPLELSSVGTIADNNGNNCALYYYPYDGDGNIELYYVVVTNALGVNQFTREGWPNVTPESNPTQDPGNTIVNLLSNPQFCEVLFDPAETLTISFTGSGTDQVVSIAPDWDLYYSHTGAGTIDVSRTAVTGISNYVTNPPYVLNINAGANLTSVSLRQRLSHNPNIWAAPVGATTGYVATNIVLGPGSGGGSQAATVQYKPSAGSASSTQTLLTATNNTGTYAEFTETVQLIPGDNTQNANTGYVDIVIYVSTSGTTNLTSVQVCSTENEASDVKFQQAPVNRQEDQLFHYYKSQLMAMPTQSYLIGWDFAYNPRQILGPTVSPFSTGANTSNYIMDQTILFQSANNAVSIATPTNKSLQITANAASSQIALIQYLDVRDCLTLLQGRMSIHMKGYSSSSAGIGGTVSLWYTTGALPSIGSNLSIVTALDSAGFPTAFSGTWTQVQRSGLGNATFNLTTTTTEQGWSGWENIAGAVSGYLAIVVGTEALSSATPDVLNFLSISLVPGDVPTNPGYVGYDQVLLQCKRFYEKSYLPAVLPGVVTLENVCIATQSIVQNRDSSGNYYVVGGIAPFEINYQQQKINTPTIAIYSPSTGAAANVYYQLAYNGSYVVQADTALSSWSVLNNNIDRISYVPSNPVALYNSLIAQGHVAVSYIQYHYVLDARLGTF